MVKRVSLLLAVILVAACAGNFIIKNFLATSLIAYGRDGVSRDLAAGYAPSNPLVVAARGKYLLYRAEPPLGEAGVAELRRAATLSPRDYRIWLELGRGYETIGAGDQAEQALRRAVDLSPRYFETRWAFANFLLRSGKTGAALQAFRTALDVSGEGASPPDHDATLNALTGIAGAVGFDPELLRGIPPQDNASRIYLSEFFATRDALDQALELRRHVSADEAGYYRRLLFQLLPILQSKGRFTELREIWIDLARLEWGGDESLTDASIINPGFEKPPPSETYPSLAAPPTGLDWTIRHHPEVVVRRDNVERHSGTYSLRLMFNAAMGSDFQNVSQLVVAEPGKEYRLSYYVKTKQLSDPSPYLEISDAIAPLTLSLKSTVPPGTNNWTEQSISFTTPETTHALRLTVRSPRLAVVDRLRIGEVWFDDFKLALLDR
jgi:hypothetical protein